MTPRKKRLTKKMRTITTNTDGSKDFYCSQKFWWLTVNLEKIQTLSCCSASPSRIDLDYLEKNPGELFNSPEMYRERQSMIDNQPVSSCSATCWQAESQGLTSRRLLMNSQHRTHTTIKSSPEMLHIITGTHCNMACLYCCKQYSSTWARDLEQHGPYPIEIDDDRYKLNRLDRVIMKLGQKDFAGTRFNKILLDELTEMSKTPSLKGIEITGGEPFLYLDLEKLVERLSSQNKEIRIWTGLGVNPGRLEKEIDKILKHDNIKIVVSAESTDKMYELLRHGNTWKRFKQNIEILEKSNVKFSFNSSITNISLYGLTDFLEFAQDKKINFQMCTDPDFLSVNVLDPKSKEKIQKNLDVWPDQLQSFLKQDLFVESKDIQRKNLGIYLKEFSKRRNVNLDFLPNHFLNWLEF